MHKICISITAWHGMAVEREARWHIGVSSASESEGTRFKPRQRLQFIELAMMRFKIYTVLFVYIHDWIPQSLYDISNIINRP